MVEYIQDDDKWYELPDERSWWRRKLHGDNRRLQSGTGKDEYKGSTWGVYVGPKEKHDYPVGGLRCYYSVKRGADSRVSFRPLVSLVPNRHEHGVLVQRGPGLGPGLVPAEGDHLSGGFEAASRGRGDAAGGRGTAHPDV